MGRASKLAGKPLGVNHTKPIVLFDGECRFCNNAVNFLIKRDEKALINYASLQSEQAKKLIKETGFVGVIPDSVILIEGKKIFFESDAALKSLRYLGGGWGLLSYLTFIPKTIRQSVYRLIARNRYKWFGKYDSCIIPEPEWKSRFIDQPAT